MPKACAAKVRSISLARMPSNVVRIDLNAFCGVDMLLQNLSISMVCSPCDRTKAGDDSSYPKVSYM